jgi:predicted permease
VPPPVPERELPDFKASLSVVREATWAGTRPKMSVARIAIPVTNPNIAGLSRTTDGISGGISCFRNLTKPPGFAAVLVLVFTLAIGGNASVFSVLSAILLRPLEFRNADRLVQITSLKDGKPLGVSGPDWRDFATQNQTFDKMAIYDQWRKNVSTSPRGDDAAEVLVGLAPPEFFKALGVQPLLGRLFTAAEGVEGRNHVALITETFWKNHYQRDLGVLGRTLSINDQRYTIIGVLPATIPGWLHKAQEQLPVFEPFVPGPGLWSEQSRGGRGNGALGLMKPGVPIAKAQADLARIAENLAATHPADRAIGVSIVPLATMRAGDLQPLLLLLMGAVGLILLIACSNLAALLLARNTARQREFAMRKALGAGRTALIRQVLTETLVLSVIGSASGLALAWGTTRALRTTDPAGADAGLEGGALHAGRRAGNLPVLWLGTSAGECAGGCGGCAEGGDARAAVPRGRDFGRRS